MVEIIRHLWTWIRVLHIVYDWNRSINRKVTLQLHQILRLPRKVWLTKFSENMRNVHSTALPIRDVPRAFWTWSETKLVIGNRLLLVLRGVETGIFSVTLPFCDSFLSHSTWTSSNSTSFWSLTSWTSIFVQVCLFQSGNLEFGTCSFRFRSAQVWWTTAEECGNGTQAFSASCAMDGADASERGASAPMSILVLGADGKPFHTFCSLAINETETFFKSAFCNCHSSSCHQQIQGLHNGPARSCIGRCGMPGMPCLDWRSTFAGFCRAGAPRIKSSKMYIEWLWMIHIYTFIPVSTVLYQHQHWLLI